MLKPKVATTISNLMIGDYFIPEGEDVVYDHGGYDPEWGLWIGINVKHGDIRMFDDMACVWLPYYNPSAVEEFWDHREEFCKTLNWKSVLENVRKQCVENLTQIDSSTQSLRTLESRVADAVNMFHIYLDYIEIFRDLGFIDEDQADKFIKSAYETIYDY